MASDAPAFRIAARSHFISVERITPFEKDHPMSQRKAADLSRGMYTPISELDLSARAQNVLYANGFTRVADILVCTEADLLRVTGIGRGVIAELRSVLSEFDPPENHPLPRGSA
jgi:DNA-directed RNA polymerase alpha subunit